MTNIFKSLSLETTKAVSPFVRRCYGKLICCFEWRIFCNFDVTLLGKKWKIKNVAPQTASRFAIICVLSSDALAKFARYNKRQRRNFYS